MSSPCLIVYFGDNNAPLKWSAYKLLMVFSVVCVSGEGGGGETDLGVTAL